MNIKISKSSVKYGCARACECAYYPEGTEKGKTKIPKGFNVSRFRLSKVKVFVPLNGYLLQCYRYKGHNPELDKECDNG